MKILFLAAGTPIVASSRTRVYQYIPYLEKEGIASTVINFASEKECKANIAGKRRAGVKLIWDKLYNFLQIFRILISALKYDIVFIQKVLLPNTLQIILRFLNERIIFDFDDAIFLVGDEKDELRDDKFFYRLINLISHSKYVILENDFTQEFASRYNNNIIKITGPVDIHRYRPYNDKGNREKIVVGWIGSPRTMIYLKPLENVFKELANRFSQFMLLLIGADGIRIEGVNVEIEKWSLETEVENLNRLDIGIMPLKDDRWCRGKGGYKLLQYMALGIPCVASGVGINRQIIRQGLNGFLADTQEEWTERLSQLLKDQELCIRMGKEARRLAEELYSYEASLPAFISMLNKVIK